MWGCVHPRVIVSMLSLWFILALPPCLFVTSFSGTEKLGSIIYTISAYLFNPGTNDKVALELPNCNFIEYNVDE
jgi:hypothetical protein